MNDVSKWLATVGVLVAGPAFLLNFVAHGGVMPGPDEVDRVDGAFSLMFMVGVGLIVAALLVAQPSPLGCKRRWLFVEATMVVLAAVWAVFITIDPKNLDSNNPLIVAGDASWPLHQLFMLFVGILAVRANVWPSPAKFALFGPAAGVIVLLISAVLNADIVAATAIGAGWAIAGAGVIAATSKEETQSASDVAVRAVATS